MSMELLEFINKLPSIFGLIIILAIANKALGVVQSLVGEKYFEYIAKSRFFLVGVISLIVGIVTFPYKNIPYDFSETIKIGLKIIALSVSLFSMYHGVMRIIGTFSDKIETLYYRFWNFSTSVALLILVSGFIVEIFGMLHLKNETIVIKPSVVLTFFSILLIVASPLLHMVRSMPRMYRGEIQKKSKRMVLGVVFGFTGLLLSYFVQQFEGFFQTGRFEDGDALGIVVIFCVGFLIFVYSAVWQYIKKDEEKEQDGR